MNVTDMYIQNQLKWHRSPEYQEQINTGIEVASLSAVMTPENEDVNLIASKDEKHINTEWFNVGSISKVWGMSLLATVLNEEGYDIEAKLFSLQFDDIIEAIWRGQIMHLMQNDNYKSFFQLVANNFELLESIQNDTYKVLKNPKLFSGTILDKIKNGYLEKYRESYQPIEVSFSEICFFTLTVSSNSSYVTVISKLCELMTQKTGNRYERFADLQEELLQRGWVKEFTIFDPRKQNQPKANSTTLSDAVNGFHSLISNFSKSQNSFHTSILEALKNNPINQECNISPLFTKWKSEGKINCIYNIYEKTGITVTIHQDPFYASIGMPPHITTSSIFTITDNTGNIIKTLGHFKSIGVLLPDPREDKNINKQHIRTVKDTHLPLFLEELEELLLREGIITN